MPNITARDVPSILGINKYENAWTVMEEKVEKKHPFFGNKFTEHGIKFESTAIRAYEMATNNTVADKQATKKHADYPWITGRLDGLTHNHCVVEIKCPWKRREEPLTIDNVPPHYWAQCQVYMNMVDAEIAHYVEYHISSECSADSLDGELMYVPVIRDRKWWEESMPKIEKFYDEMNKWVAVGSLDDHPIRVAQREWETQFM